MSDRLTGTLVDGRYKVVGRLGTGGMAEVFLAEDQQLGRKLALKLLHARFAEDPGFVERFRREAQAAAGLQHPNVVGVYDRGAWDDTYYIAMEYVPGRTLKQVISEEAPLEPIRAIHLVEEILKAVRFAHRRGVIHRDLKPHNVIVDESDHAKVTDFGIARAGASDMTETGSILGTAQYLSPEQAQGLAVSPSSDLYSVGVILYELLTGRVPFDAEAAVTVAIKHVSEAPVAPRTLNPLIPPPLEQVVLWSLNKNPADRPADADEFLAALHHARAAIISGVAPEATAALTAVAVQSAPAIGSTAPTALAAVPAMGVEPGYGNGTGAPLGPAPPPRRRRDVWLWAGLVALLLAAAIAAAIFLLTAGNQVNVPGVVGRPVKAATTVLKRAGFKVKVAHARSQKPQGVVIHENPAANAAVNQGSTVRLTVSAGPGNVTVPQLKNMPLTQAESTIRHARLKVGKVQYVSNTSVAAGAVSSTSPFAGEPEPPGTPINIFVSSGPPKKTVPDVTGDTESAARAALGSAGFLVAVSTKTTSAAPAGTVFSQSPAGGSQATAGSTITIVVAQKPPPPPPAKPTVPGVTGETAAQAKGQLSAAGFTVNEVTQTVKNKSKNGIVLSQSPGAGTRVAKGTTVTIVVGSYQAPPTTTPTHTNTNPGGGPARLR